MSILLKKVFGRENNIIIGAVHLPPLLGYPKFPGLKIATQNALADLNALEKGGAHGIIFENNYDLPHATFAAPGTVASMALVGQELRKATSLPLGINVLWNDYPAALALAKLLNLQFIRVPVFVDDVKTQYCIIKSSPKEIIAMRTKLAANNVALLTDIQVKHSIKLQKRSLDASARLAIKAGADALIVTGKWTGNAPEQELLQELKNEIPSFPILIGSGVNEKNITPLFHFANGAIVSTSLKKGGIRADEINVKAYSQRIDQNKVKKLLAQI
ncbi:MAG: BtpA/SgcQ family protein [Candidatus Wildermuthbacteria bacterium]|nr:BtpA/SgcQ family protein [Candidatus Wildermuthbacteria bacterium]